MNKQYKTIQVNKKTVRLHRYIMEEHIGRKLKSSELVHHKNEDRHDNRVENLEILSRSEHRKIHPDIGIETRRKQKYYFNKEELINLRNLGLSTYKIAKKYNCSHSLIWLTLKKYGIR